MGMLPRFLLAVALAGCGSPSDPTWEIVAHDLPSALLSVWAGSPNNVWVVGGASDASTSALVEHYDGTSWTKFDIGHPGVDIWWVKGFDDGEIFMGGAHGLILRTHDGSSFTTMATPFNVTVFGIWGASSTDAWAVGGLGGAGGGFAWRSTGSDWTQIPNFPPDLVSSGGTCWKVNGRAADDVWISCTSGTTLHWNGSALERADIADAQTQQYSLFSIASNATRAVAVGGDPQTGRIYENAGTGWTGPTSALEVRLSGVAISDDDAYAVGGNGAILRRGSDGKWTNDSHGLTQSDLHAAYIDPSGDVWAVGGVFDHMPTQQGVLLHKGATLEGSFE